MTTPRVTAAFLPLLDAALLIAAHEKGFAEAEGVALDLVRETSWANVRDRIAIGQFDVAHMLAPMPIAANLGLTPFDTEIIVPMALGLGGNAITVSTRLRQQLGVGDGVVDAAQAGRAVRNHIDALAQEPGAARLRFGVVHPHSSHNLELRYWLSACGVRPGTDCEIVILPPGLMPDALREGKIDGYCVGEPWNTASVMRGDGSLLTTKHHIWASSPEKVLGAHGAWAASNADTLAALVRALHASAQWCSDVANRADLAAILALPAYLGVASTVIEAALAGPAGYEPFARAATFPWQSHAMWFYTQLVRWDMASHSPEGLERARQTYRPDIYRAALKGTDALIPTSNLKVEGALRAAVPVGATGGHLELGPDGFFDGRVFDPDAVDAYLSGFNAV